MALFPQSFLDDLKAQTNIVALIGDVVQLKKAGATHKGLCPFHQERTPSFNVNGDKGFFKCFGCGAGGDAVKFVELHQKLTFPEAVRYLAQRAGMAVPESQGGPDEREASALRDSLVHLHEDAAAFYREQLELPAGARARRELELRGLTAETIATFGYGYAPAGGRDTLRTRFADRKVPVDLQLRSGLIVERDGGALVDRFRNRLMIPIARDSGALVAFGGRALDEGQVPKYLNSPETAVYTKGRTLYGLHVTKGALRKHNYCVLVEGYFDLAQVWQAGIHPVVASCGTALTNAQAKVLKRFTSKVVLSFDPDAAGQGAATRSSELLVSEGFQVNVALLPEGSDPDTFVRREGGQRVRRPAHHVAAVPGLSARSRGDAARRQAAGRPARVSERHARGGRDDSRCGRARSICRSARAQSARHRSGDARRDSKSGGRQAAGSAGTGGAGRGATAARGIGAALDAGAPAGRRPGGGRRNWTPTIWRAWRQRACLSLATGLGDVPPDFVPGLLRERLNDDERALLDGAAAATMPPAGPSDCVQAIRRMRIERDIAAVQEEIDRLQSVPGESNDTLAALWAKKKDLLTQL